MERLPPSCIEEHSREPHEALCNKDLLKVVLNNSKDSYGQKKTSPDWNFCKEKKSRAHQPLSFCALFQLSREVFEACRLNLGVTINVPLRLCKRFLTASLWKAVHGCAKVPPT
jgi:hypothetical protein